MNSLMNPSYELVAAVTIFVVVLTALLIVKAFLARQIGRLAERRPLPVLDYLREIIDATRMPFFIGVSVLAALSQFALDASYEKYWQYAWMIILISQIALWGNRVIDVAVGRSIEKSRTTNPAGATQLMLIGLLGRVAVWAVALLMTLDNLGFNITTLMASLGIGGIAVALAVQNILGDMFSSISISLDKPFVIGDFIVVDNFMGTVEYIGMKTTRLRSLGGEQIIFSNNELLKQRIRNYKRMQERRIQFEFGVTYETPVEVLEQIPGMVKEIVGSEGWQTRFDRAHFKGFGDSALTFEVVYFVLSPDFNAYMDIQEKINLALMRRLQSLDVSFAYPTRTLYLAGGTALQEALQPAARPGQHERMGPRPVQSQPHSPG